MHQSLFREQTPDQGQGTVALFGHGQVAFVHPPSVGLYRTRRAGMGVSLPVSKEFFKPKLGKWAENACAGL
jgi:hypothetical protein